MEKQRHLLYSLDVLLASHAGILGTKKLQYMQGSKPFWLYSSDVRVLLRGLVLLRVLRQWLYHIESGIRHLAFTRSSLDNAGIRWK